MNKHKAGTPLPQLALGQRITLHHEGGEVWMNAGAIENYPSDLWLRVSGENGSDNHESSNYDSVDHMEDFEMKMQDFTWEPLPYRIPDRADLEALKALSPDQIAEAARFILRAGDLPHKIWLPEDISSQFELDTETGLFKYHITDETFTKEQVEEITNIAQGTREWNDLGDILEQEWGLVFVAIGDAIEEMREEETREQPSSN